MPEPLNQNETLQNQPLRIFLSFAWPTREAVRALAIRLRKAGFVVWWAESLLPGQDFDHEISTQLRNSDIALFCISSYWNLPGWKHRELRLALKIAEERPENSVYIVPARLEPSCFIPESLMRYQVVDLTDRKHYLQLIKGLKTLSSLRKNFSTNEHTVNEPARDHHRMRRRCTDRIDKNRAWLVMRKDYVGQVIQDRMSPRVFHCLVQRGTNIVYLSQEENRDVAFARCHEILDEMEPVELDETA